MQVIDVEAKVILHYDSLYGSSTLSESQHYWSKYTFIYSFGINMDWI